MVAIGWVLAALGTLAVGTLSRLLAEDVKAWIPRINGSLIAHAVKRLPEGQRERFSEEWSSHVLDTPGELCKLRAAFGTLIASRRMGDEVWRKVSKFSQKHT
jgi:hypothetical protein